MTTARKPPLPPIPKKTKPQATPKRSTGAAAEIMARCKLIRDESEGKLDNASIAIDLHLTKQEVSQYLTGSGGLPYGDRMVSFILWGLRHNKALLKDLTA